MNFIYDFTLTGDTPLLMNHNNIEFRDTLAEWIADKENVSKSKAGDDRTPPWSWHGRMYTDGLKVAMPQDNIMSCLKAAGAKIPTGKRGGNYKKATQSCLMISTLFCEFVGSEGEIKVENFMKFKGETFARQRDLATDLGFSLFVKAASVNGKSHTRVRPRFESWAIRGKIEILDTNEMPPAKMAEIFDVAGKMVGLGDWRPGVSKSPGPYGRFLVELKPSKSR